MASGKTLQSTIEISGVLSPSLQSAINSAVSRLSDMAEETLDSADAASRLVAEMSEQEDVLNALKKAYAGYAVEGKESSEEAQKLAQTIQSVSGELTENRQKLDAAERAADSFGNELEQAEAKAESANDGFTVMKGVLANLVTKGLEVAANGVRNLYSSYEQFDDGADTVIKATGATGAAAEGLAKSYEAVSGSVLGDFSEIGGALGEINTRFGFTGTELENSSVQFLKFADITGTDALSAVQLVSRAMGDAGIETTEYSSLLDTLAVAAQSSGISVDKLSENLTKYGAPMRALGFDTQESIALFSQWEKCGVNTEIAFSGMKKAISNWSKEGKDSRVEFEKALETIKSCPDIASATTKAIEIFGAKAGPDLADAIQGGRFEYSQFLDTLENSQGTVTETYEATQDGMDKIKLAIQKLKAKAGAAISKFFDDHKDTIVRLIEKAGTAVEWLADKLPYLGIALGAVGAVIAAMKWGSITAGVGKAISAFKGIGTALTSIPGPVLVIIGIIAALAAAFVYLWKTNEDFRNNVGAIWEQLKGSFSELGSTLGNTLSQLAPIFSELASTFMTAVAQIAGALIPVLLEIISSILPVILDLINMLLPVILQIIQAVLPIIIDLINQLLPVIMQIIQFVLPILVQLIQTLLPFIMQIIQAVLPVIIDLINQLLPIIMQIIQAVLPVIIDLINQLLPFIMQIIQAVLPVIIDLINQLLPMVMQIIQAVLPVLLQLIQALMPIILMIVENVLPVLVEVLNILIPIITTVANVISSVLGAAIKMIQPIIQGLTSVFQGLIDFITGIFSGNWSQAWDGIVGVFKNIWNGIVSIFKTPINWIIDGINKFLGGLNKIKIPDWVPGVGGKGINIPMIPKLAAGGFTDGISIAGEAGMEAVISFDRAYRDKNIGIWEKAGELLGVYGNQNQGGGLTGKAGELLTLDNFSLGSLADGTNVVIYYDFSGFTWSPQIHANGNSNNEDDLMARLKAHEAEFFDWLEEFIQMREVAQYA